MKFDKKPYNKQWMFDSPKGHYYYKRKQYKKSRWRRKEKRLVSFVAREWLLKD